MYDNHWEEHCDFHYTSEAEWDRAAACEIGAMHPDWAWICSDRDVWYPNPFYTGPAVPHPEYEGDDDGGLVQPVQPIKPKTWADYGDEIPF